VTRLTSSEDPTVYSTGQFSPHHSNSVSNHTTKRLVLFLSFSNLYIPTGHLEKLIIMKNLDQQISKILNLSFHNMVKTVPSTTLLKAKSPEMFKIRSTTRLHLKADTMHFTPVCTTR